MASFRKLAVVFVAVLITVTSISHADIGILPIPDQDIPSGKTLVVPIAASDPGGPPRSYTVSVGTSGGISTEAAGINAVVRTGDPHLILAVTYTDSNGVLQSGTMEFQLLREFVPVTTQIISGLTEGGFYNNLTFHRIIPGFVIQGGDPNGDGTGGPGFTFPNEFSSALIFSGAGGQLAMANSGPFTNHQNGSNGSQFFVTLPSTDPAQSNRLNLGRSLDYGYNIFGQILRGFDTATGIAGTALEDDGNGDVSKPVSPVNITSATVIQNDTDAVLILSATGICDLPVSVTASSGTSIAVQTFTAHGVTDFVNDTPFLKPVADTVVSKPALTLALQATDLQLDFLRYGMQEVLPVTGTAAPFFTSGTCPLESVALISNTDNTVTDFVQHWYTAGSSAGTYDAHVIHAAVGDKPLRGSLSPIPPGQNGSLVLNPYPVAVFTAGNSKDTAASFTASVNWGDGTYLSGNEVSIVRDGSARTVNRYKLIAGHTYKASGEYPVLVNISDTGGARLALTSTACIGPASLALSGRDIYKTGGKLKNQLVAEFTDTALQFTNTNYAATVDWGDGAVTSGTIKRIHAGIYQVLGSHDYSRPDTYTVSATVARAGAGGYAASEWSAAHISGIKAPQVYPPFPQAHLAQVWNPLYTDSTMITSGSNAGLIQISLRGSMTVINSGNVTSAAGSLAVYANSANQLDGNQIAFVSDGQVSNPIPSLKPGQQVTFLFEATTTTDYRLKLPPGYDPKGQYILGVVTYSDPVADFDGSSKVISVGSF